MIRKQDVVKKICEELDIQVEKNFFSSGSKVTGNAILAIYKAINKKQPLEIYIFDRTKHGLVREIASLYGIAIMDHWFSTGSTVTTSAFTQIYDAIKKRHDVEKFDEGNLPIYIDDNNIVLSMNDVLNKINKKEITKEDWEKINNDFINYSTKRLLELIKKRIEENIYFKYMTFDNIEIDRDKAIEEIYKTRSSIGQIILKIEKKSLILTYKILSERIDRGIQ